MEKERTKLLQHRNGKMIWCVNEQSRAMSPKQTEQGGSLYRNILPYARAGKATTAMAARSSPAAGFTFTEEGFRGQVQVTQQMKL